MTARGRCLSPAVRWVSGPWWPRGLGWAGGWWLVGGVLLLVRVCFRSRTPSDLRVCVLEGVLGGVWDIFWVFFLGALTCGFVLFGRACGGLCPTLSSAIWLTVVVPPRGTPRPHTASGDGGRPGRKWPQLLNRPKGRHGPCRSAPDHTVRFEGTRGCALRLGPPGPAASNEVEPREHGWQIPPPRRPLAAALMSPQQGRNEEEQTCE